MSESVKGRTDPRTDGRGLESHPVSSPRAFDSGELKRLKSSVNQPIAS